jgi:hypothetical protein
MCSVGAESLGSLQHELLGDGDIDKGGMDVLVPQIGSQVWQSCLCIYSFAIPSQEAGNDEGMSQVMDAWPNTTRQRFETGLADYLAQ